MHKPLSQLTRDLMEARNLIDEPHKWIQNCARDGERYCMTGAIGVIALSRKIYATEMISAIRGQIPPGFPSIEEFNDAVSTTHADIMAVFDEAIQASI